jgi:hypothetical protein
MVLIVFLQLLLLLEAAKVVEALAKLALVVALAVVVLLKEVTLVALERLIKDLLVALEQEALHIAEAAVAELEVLG